jgi:hypothetical protein
MSTKTGLMERCALVIFTLIAASTARAGNDGVIFDGSSTNSGVAGGTASFAVSSSGGFGNAETPSGGSLNMALGTNATVSGANAAGNIAIGTCASTGELGAIAASCVLPIPAPPAPPFTSGANTAMGMNADARGFNSTAIGGAFSNAPTLAIGNNASAFGSGAEATANNATAVGFNASAGFAGSSAFGTGATATMANQQMFGTSSNIYTMPGITTTSTAAQTGPLQLVTSDASGTLGTNTVAGLGLATTSQLSALSSSFGSQLNSINSQLSSRIDSVNTEARRGIAATAAMAYAPTPTRPGATTLAINGSVYENTGGVGVAFQHRFANTSIPVYFSGAYGNGGGRENVGRAGFAFEW